MRRLLLSLAALSVVAGCSSKDDPPIVSGEWHGQSVSYRHAFYGVTTGSGGAGPTAGSPQADEYNITLTNRSDYCALATEASRTGRWDDEGLKGIFYFQVIFAGSAMPVALGDGTVAMVTARDAAIDAEGRLSTMVEIVYFDRAKIQNGRATGTVAAEHCRGSDRLRG